MNLLIDLQHHQIVLSESSNKENLYLYILVLKPTNHQLQRLRVRLFIFAEAGKDHLEAILWHDGKRVAVKTLRGEHSIELQDMPTNGIAFVHVVYPGMSKTFRVNF